MALRFSDWPGCHEISVGGELSAPRNNLHRCFGLSAPFQTTRPTASSRHYSSHAGAPPASRRRPGACQCSLVWGARGGAFRPMCAARTRARATAETCMDVSSLWKKRLSRPTNSHTRARTVYRMPRTFVQMPIPLGERRACPLSGPPCSLPQICTIARPRSH